MAKCCICESRIENGFLFGFWGINEETKPICVNCLKKIIDSNGKDMGLDFRIEKWIAERNHSFAKINEPTHMFHFILKNLGPLKIPVEIFQEKEKPELIVGFMTFLSKELTFKIYRFSEGEKQEFKNKVDAFLSTLRVDHRTGIRVSCDIISDKGSYGAKYFLKAKSNSCDKELFYKMIDMVKETSVKSDQFLRNELLN